MIGEDHTIPVDRAPGSIPCDHCLDDLEDRLRYAVYGKPDETVSSPLRVNAAWVEFRAHPGEDTWREFIYRTSLLVREEDVRRILGDIDPWPLATITAFDHADALWSGHWPDD